MTILKQISIDNKTARRFLLEHQQLLEPRKRKGNKTIIDLIRHLNCIQFDTINVVGRNADLVLQSRIKDYRPSMLNNLLYIQRSLFDAWDKQASIILVEDWPFLNKFREQMKINPDRRYQGVKEAIPDIKQRLENDGPLSSLDFDKSKKVEWHWSHTSLARAGLEFMWYTGQVGVHHRINTRRSFDLIERLIPKPILNISNPNQTEDDYQEWHVLRRIGSLGLASIRSGEYWSGIVGVKAAERKRAVNSLIEKGLVIEVSVENYEKGSLFIRAEDLEVLEKVARKRKISNKTSFIAPLDNLIWNRKLIKEIFNFEYVWEVYKPKAIRKYGYYTLPVLYGDNFIARFDSKFDRKTNILNIENWWWEDNILPDEEMFTSIADNFRSFMNYLGTEKITFDNKIKFNK
jgi:uncharacterized protein YcaQ